MREEWKGGRGSLPGRRSTYKLRLTTFCANRAPWESSCRWDLLFQVPYPCGSYLSPQVCLCILYLCLWNPSCSSGSNRCLQAPTCPHAFFFSFFKHPAHVPYRTFLCKSVLSLRCDVIIRTGSFYPQKWHSILTLYTFLWSPRKRLVPPEFYLRAYNKRWDFFKVNKFMHNWNAKWNLFWSCNIKKYKESAWSVATYTYQNDYLQALTRLRLQKVWSLRRVSLVEKTN